MPAIFLSYRHGDNADRVNNVRAWLVQHGVPKGEIFLDTDDTSIPPRAAFPDKIGTAMENALCALIIIGPRWLRHRRPGLFKRRSLFEREDWVRKEIEIAQWKPGRSLPLLLDNTPMPQAHDLPPSIQAIHKIEYLRLRGGAADFDEDMVNVARAMAGALTERFRWEEPQRQFNYLPGERAAYLDALIARYGVLDLPIAVGVSLPAGDIYQPLRLRKDPALPAERSREESWHEGHGPRTDEDYEDHSDHNRTLDRSDQGKTMLMRADSPASALALSPTHQMVVLGGPGSGKTTLLHQLALSAAHRAREDAAAPLPAVLSLPALAASGQWTVEMLPIFIKDALAGMNKSLPPEKQSPTTISPLLAHDIMRGATFLCLDGLDEVTPGRRKGVLGWISELPMPGADAAVIIGSRFTDYREGDLPRREYAEWELENLTTQIRTALISELLPQLDAAFHQGVMSTDALDAAQLLEQLRKDTGISWWGDSPLLLTLAAFVFVKRNGKLPKRRVELYREVVSSLLQDRLERDNAFSPFALESTHDLLSMVTLDLFATIGQVFTVRQLTESIRARCMDLNITGEADMGRMYQRVIQSGLLEPQASGTFKYRHPTFQEYLTGAGLAWMLIAQDSRLRDRAWALLEEKSVMSRWLEPLALMAGVLVTQHSSTGQRAAGRWIRGLSKHHIGPQGDPGYLMLGQALHALRDVAGTTDPDLREAQGICLNAWADALAEAARVLGRLGERVPVEPLLQALTDSDGGVRKAAVETLSRLGEQVPVDALVQALTSPDSSVREAAVNALGGLGERTPVGPLVQALSDSDSSVRKAAVEALSRLGERAPVEPLLEALTDSSSSVRQAAAEALGKLGEQVSVEPLIWAMQDEDENVCQAARLIVKDREPAEIEHVAMAAACVLLRTVSDPAEIRAFGVSWQVEIVTTIGNIDLSLPALVAKVSASLDWPHWRVKVAAAEALGKITRHIPSTVVEQLMAMRGSRSEMRIVREACDDAVATILAVDPMEDTL